MNDCTYGVLSSAMLFLIGASCQPCWARNHKIDRIWNIWELTYPPTFTGLQEIWHGI